MNSLKREIQSLVRELDDLKDYIEDSIKIDDEPFEEEKINDILDNVRQTANSL